ncbi:MAG: DUF4388 domain-containing protein, partial [Planctomycetota bacterium]
PLELVRFLLEALLDRRIRRLTDKEHRERLDQSVAQNRLDDAIAYAKSAVAFGFSSDEYRRRLVDFRDRRKGMPSSEGRPTVQGELGQVSLAEVLQLLHTGKRSGTLRITASTGSVPVGSGSGAMGSGSVSAGSGSLQEKTLYLDAGEVYILSVEGPAPDSDLQELLGESAGDRLGMSALLQSTRGSSIGEDDIGKQEMDRIKNELFEAFLWEGARFEFLQNFLPPELRSPAPNTTKLALKTELLLIEAMQRLNAWDEMRQVLKSAHAVFRFATSEAKADAITGEDGALAYLFDGELSLVEVVRRSGEDRFRVYKFASDLVTKGALIYSHQKHVSGLGDTPTRRIVASGRFQTVPPPDSNAGKPRPTGKGGRGYPGLSGVVDRSDDSIHELSPANNPGANNPGANTPEPRKWGAAPPPPPGKKTTTTRPALQEPLTPLPLPKPSATPPPQARPKTQKLESKETRTEQLEPFQGADDETKKKKKKLGKSSVTDAKKKKWGGNSSEK